VFSTPDAAHGHPRRVVAPEGRKRLCFSAYYFTSPDQPDSPPGRNGVLFSERSERGGAAELARRLVPPVVADWLRAARRWQRRRAADG
jgi:hypothetical protein